MIKKTVVRKVIKKVVAVKPVKVAVKPVKVVARPIKVAKKTLKVVPVQKTFNNSISPALMAAYGCTTKEEIVDRILSLASLVAHISHNNKINLNDAEIDIIRDLK